MHVIPKIESKLEKLDSLIYESYIINLSIFIFSIGYNALN